MTIVTLARQVGSGGHAIATALADRSGLHVIGRKELRDEAAKQGLTLPQSFVRFASEDSSFSGLNHYLSYGELEFDLALRGALQASGETHDPGFLEEITAHSREILLTLQVLIYDLAAKGNVLFVGAGAQILLAGIPNVLRVKIIAPTQTRIERMKSAYGLSDEEAKAAVLGGDREQVDYNRVIFGEDWNNPELWDIVVNSDVLSVEQIVEMIVSQLPSKSTLPSLDQRLVHASMINRKLLAAPKFAHVYAFAIPSTTGIVIRGEAATDEVHKEIIELATSIVADEEVIDALADYAMC